MDDKDIIWDLMKRIIKLEKEVELLKNKNETIAISKVEQNENKAISYNNEKTSGRDKTRYMFNGNVYLKNRLVLAVVSKYVEEHPCITIKELKQVFNKSLQGSIGVVEDEFYARQRADYSVRFFAKEGEILKLVDGNAYVCTQWGILNIPNFVARARQLGYQIEEI